ncbi:MAG: CARDB domain-containing protein [Verrucomicrobiota bacterium]|nr:CARDB domain-containing protein [Verrucomicrobiota bacterium]
MLELLDWRLTWDLADAVIALAVLGLSVYLSRKTWLRSGKKNSVLALECLRFLTVFMILATLLNPEQVEQLDKKGEPEIVCLLDVSGSMSTLDVIDSNGSVESRIDWARKSLDSDWKRKLEQNSTVTVRNFSSQSGTQATNLSMALGDTLEGTGNLKAVLFLSDGDSNDGPSILSLAGKCRSSGVPVYSIRVGSPKPLPDLALEDAFAPSFALQEEKITINYRISNAFDTRQKSSLKLMANEQVVSQKPVLLPASEEIAGSIAWLPPGEGDYELKLTLDQVPGESLPGNNERILTTRVENKIIKALLVDSFPRWEYRFLRNALERDPGVDMKCVLFHPGMAPGEGKGYLPGFPQSKDDLASFDVVFLGDVGLGENELNEEQCENLANLIRLQASGLVFLPGRRGRQLTLSDSPVEELLPVVYDPEKPTGLGTSNPSGLQLTARGKDHWLTNLRGAGEPDRQFWERLPGFHWSAIVRKSRPGSEVLAVHSNFRNDWGRMPTLAIRYAGAGKTLYLGSDAAWRWRRGVEDKYHYRFWSQVVRWMAHGRYLAEKEGIRVIPDPERPKAGEKVFVRAIVLDQAGFPLEDGEVRGLIAHPGGQTENLLFNPAEEGPGVYLASFKAREAGPLEMKVTAEPAERELSLTLSVEKPTREKLGKPVVSRDLGQLSELTGGESENYLDYEKVVQSLSFLPDPKPITRIHRLRTDTAWGLFLFGLLAIYWTGRKLVGMI